MNIHTHPQINVLATALVVEESADQDLRLAICLRFLVRRTYYHTIFELCVFGLSTVATTVKQVSEAIAEILWEDSVSKYMPNFREYLP